MRAVVVVIFYYDVYVVSSELICGACGFIYVNSRNGWSCNCCYFTFGSSP